MNLGKTRKREGLMCQNLILQYICPRFHFFLSYVIKNQMVAHLQILYNIKKQLNRDLLIDILTKFVIFWRNDYIGFIFSTHIFQKRQFQSFFMK